jgi:hypothetical protein
MDADTLRRATEPFFTTKGVGKGTGLGLPMVHGMAAQIGGAFELQSEKGRGTSAILWLPVAGEVAVAPAILPEDQLVSTAQLRILAVDDDALVLLNTAALLEDLGHQVVEASSVDEALDHFGDGNHFDLVMTDQRCPTGPEPS